MATICQGSLFRWRWWIAAGAFEQVPVSVVFGKAEAPLFITNHPVRIYPNPSSYPDFDESHEHNTFQRQIIFADAYAMLKPPFTFKDAVAMTDAVHCAFVDDAKAEASYRPKRKEDKLSLGLNWGRPSTETFGDGLRDQYTAAFYYRYQLLKSLAITPDLQLLVNPSLNDNEDMIVVSGIRARLNF